jgi:hypothetical protein
MSKLYTRTIYILSVLLLFAMLGGPQLVQAQQSSQQGVTATTGTTQPPAQAMPDAPSSTQQDQQPANAKQKDKTPLGAAAAEAGLTAGGAASRPAGSAIAPAKQGQRRSFLIKLGLVAAGGAALGAVYLLSRGTSSLPPGSGR